MFPVLFHPYLIRPSIGRRHPEPWEEPHPRARRRWIADRDWWRF